MSKCKDVVECIEDFQRQLPQFLSLAEKESISEALKKFPKEFNPYTTLYKNEVLQGDAFPEMPFYVFEKEKVISKLGMLISNTCDMSPENKRPLPLENVVAAMIKLDSYRQLLMRNVEDSKRVDSIIADIKAQRVTNIFYLPKHPNCSLEDDHIVCFDKLSSIPSKFMKTADKKVFTLGQFGFYMLLFKLSVHFCRFHEKISRDNDDDTASTKENSTGRVMN